MSDIAVEISAGIAKVTLSRPQTMNALREAEFRALSETFANLSKDKSVRALLLTGSGRAFCSGADLSDPMMGGHLPPQDRGAATQATLGGLMNPVMKALRDLPFPTVCAVNGVAAGGGVGLALACDMVVAARSAKFVVTFTPKLGLVPDLGSSWHLARHLGRARAMGIMLTGEPVSAEQAVELGLIWKVVDDGDLEQTSGELATRLAAGPRRGQAAARALLDAAFVNDFGAQLDAERDAQASLVGGAEVLEALAAFAEKRRPDFSGKA